MLFESQKECCEAHPEACAPPADPTPEEPDAGPDEREAMWYPAKGMEGKACVKGKRYPEVFLQRGILFESERECCEAHPDACAPPADPTPEDPHLGIFCTK